MLPVFFSPKHEFLLRVELYPSSYTDFVVQCLFYFCSKPEPTIATIMSFLKKETVKSCQTRPGKELQGHSMSSVGCLALG